MQPHTQFYFIPNKELAVFWSPKCACGAIGNWAKAAIQELDDFRINPDPRFGADARFNLNSRGYNFQLYNLKYFVMSGQVTTIGVSTRDPVSRMRSSYINKFLVYKSRVIRKYDSLEFFAKDFIDLTRAARLSSTERSIRRNQRKGRFRISLASFMEAVAVEKRVRLVDSHFRPQFHEQAHIDEILQCSSMAEILPLRTESLTEDISELNKKTRVDYVPEKDNASDMPDGWQFSDSVNTIEMSNRELIKAKTLPSLSALRQWLEKNEPIQKAFSKRFNWDYEIRRRLGV
jgi:hypothetical protein